MQLNFPKTVLLIDDDPDDGDIFINALKRCCEWVEFNYEQDGEIALERIHNESLPVPDIIFLDWRMPIIEGKEILIALRNQPHFDRTPIVIFTDSHLENWNELIKLGANYFLSKPSSIKDLTNELKHIFEKELSQRSDI